MHVFLGDGGVGKTTLAAGYALALARQGRRVGLLSIDPARRLQSALGLTLAEREVRVPAPGELYAAVLQPEATLRRWATEGITDDGARQRLLSNPFFRVLADRLGATTDVIAAVRIVEWLEQDASLTNLVVDTAPGRSGVEFLLRPAALVAFVQGRLAGWLRRLAGGAGHASTESHGLGARLLRSLSHVAGMEALLELAQLVSVVEQSLHRVLARLERAQALVHEPSTRLFLVTTIREDAILGAGGLRDALLRATLSPAALLVNETMPPSLATELGAVVDLPPGLEAPTLVRYVRAYVAIQTRVLEGASSLAPAVILLAARSGLDGDLRLAKLAELGEELSCALGDFPTVAAS